jgi:hypothetical protein
MKRARDEGRWNMKTNWHHQVIQHLIETDDELFKLAIKACENESETRAPNINEAVAFLKWMRCDEPADTLACGETAKAYADFLIQEWKLFGPGGE